MQANRLSCYLEGGTPPGARTACPGCRDDRPPRADTKHELPGGIYFAMESQLWGGGLAFYDPALPGTAPARPFDQYRAVHDIAAQEMHRAPVADSDLDLRPVLASGRDQLGPGRYETLLYLGELDGHPVLTFTAAWQAADVEWTAAPSAPYLCMLAGGLGEAHEWNVHRTARYLAALPGSNGVWSVAGIALLCSGAKASFPKLDRD